MNFQHVENILSKFLLFFTYFIIRVFRLWIGTWFTEILTTFTRLQNYSKLPYSIPFLVSSFCFSFFLFFSLVPVVSSTFLFLHTPFSLSLSFLFVSYYLFSLFIFFVSWFRFFSSLFIPFFDLFLRLSSICFFFLFYISYILIFILTSPFYSRFFLLSTYNLRNFLLSLFTFLFFLLFSSNLSNWFLFFFSSFSSALVVSWSFLLSLFPILQLTCSVFLFSLIYLV